MEGVRYDPAWLYRKTDPFTQRMFDRIDAEKLKKQEKENDLKKFAAKIVADIEESDGWPVVEESTTLKDMSREERQFWLAATFGQRFGRAAIEQDAYRSRRLVVASEEADNG